MPPRPKLTLAGAKGLDAMVQLFRNNKGLSLMEVLVAVVILGIVIAPLTGFFYMSHQRARTTVIERQALAVAEARLEALRQDGFPGYRLEEGQEDIVVEETEGKFTVETVAHFDEDLGLTRVTVTVSHDRVRVTLSTLVSRFR